MSNIMSTPNSSYGKFFIIPQTKADREFLQRVDDRTRLDIEDHFGIVLQYPWICTTVTVTVIETLIQEMNDVLRKGGGGDGMSIDFFSLFKEIVSIKNNSKAEKEGNINIAFEPGDKVYDMIQNGPRGSGDHYSEMVDPYNFFRSDDPEENEFNIMFDHHVVYSLGNQCGITFTYPDEEGKTAEVKFGAIAIAYTYMENLFAQILYDLAAQNETAEDGDELHVVVNFLDLIEIHGIMKNQEVSILMRPGMNAKLKIKYDANTEHTFGEEDDD